jgi:hypothetical protein
MVRYILLDEDQNAFFEQFKLDNAEMMPRDRNVVAVEVNGELLIPEELLSERIYDNLKNALEEGGHLDGLTIVERDPDTWWPDEPEE